MNTKLKAKIAAMSPEDLYRAIYTDCLTGAMNRKAFGEADWSCVAVIDLDSLKYLNDTDGHRVGDSFLKGLARALTEDCGYDAVFRMSGDEFAVVSDAFMSLRLRLENVRDTFPGFSYGIGLTVEAADAALRKDKARREMTGLRAARGVCPPWIDTVQERFG